MTLLRNAIGKTVAPALLVVALLAISGAVAFRLPPTSAAGGSFVLSANPSSASVAQGDGYDFPMTITPSGYQGTVNLTVASCPPGATCTFDGEASKSINVNDTTSVTMRVATSATGTPIGSYSNITVVGTDSVNQSLFASTVVLLTVTQGKGFALRTGSDAYTVDENSTGTISVIMEPFQGFAEDVIVTWGIRPANNGITFDPTPGSVTLTGGAPSAIIKINAGSQTAGMYTLDFSGTSASGIVHTANGIKLTVTSGTCAGSVICGDGQTCTASGCRIDPAPTSSSCNGEACYIYDADSGALKDPAPDGCWASWPACQNVSVLKVRKDRQCNQWLGCRASIAGTVTQGDGTSKLTEPQCTQLGVCAQLGPDGRCLHYINPGTTKENISFDTPGQVTGSNSLIRWFSGYSSGFRYATAGQTIVANYPAVNISETGLSGATTPDLVVNGTFEELRCLGGSRDGESCVVPSDCRVGQGVCVDQTELNGPVNVSSSFPCTSNKDCKNQKVNNTPVPNCRYLASWGGDALCRNPFDAKWLGVLPPHSQQSPRTAWEDVGYGYSPGESSYEADIQYGIRRRTSVDVAVRWRVWEDDANFTDQSGNIGTDGDPRFPSYSPYKHIKEGNNFLKVEVQPNAPLSSGVGIPLGQALTEGAQYTLSFKYKINAASGQALVPIKAQIGMNYERSAGGGGSFHGYDNPSDPVTIGTINGTQSVCAVDPSTGCAKNSECDGSLCVDTGKWQEFTMTSNTVGGITQGKVAVLEFVTAKENGSSAFTYYIDDVSLKPVLNTGTVDEPKVPLPADSELFKLPRRCRLFPKINSPDCQYTTKDGTMFNGWRGYCLDKDPRNADLCLTWWPLDLLAGEGGLGGIPQGYTGPAPLFQCVEQGSGPMYIDKSHKFLGFIDPLSIPIPENERIRLRDIERIDVLFDADDETGDKEEWSDFNGNCNGPCVAGATQWSRNGPSDPPGGPGSRFAFQVDTAAFNRVTSDNGYRLTLQLQGGGIEQNYDWGLIPCEGDSNKQWVAVRFHFSDNTRDAVLKEINYKMCDQHQGVDGDQRFRFIIRARQSCNYVVQTVDNSQGTVQEKSWTNRVKPLSGYLVPNVQIPYTSDLAPYGSIAPPVAGTTPNGWGNWTPDGTFDAGIQVLDSASGSPRAGTPYSLESAPSFSQDKYCFNAAIPNEPVNDPRSGVPDLLMQLNTCDTSAKIISCIATSDDSQCIGRPAKRCSANPQQPCSIDTDCKGFGQCVGVRNSKDNSTSEIVGAAKGIDNLKHIFAKSFGCWKLNAELVDGNAEGKKVQLSYKEECPISIGGIWDVKADEWPSCGDNTRTDDSLCYVAPKITNISVNAVTSGEVRVSTNDQVTLKFNYAVDAEQQPARYIKVVWDGPGSCANDAGWTTAPSSPVVATTDYSLIGAGEFKPTVCVKDNWEEVGSSTFGGTLIVAD